MKPKKRKPLIDIKKLDITYDPSLNGKYANDPVMLKKVAQAKETLKRSPIPDWILNIQKKEK